MWGQEKFKRFILSPLITVTLLKSVYFILAELDFLQFYSPLRCIDSLFYICGNSLKCVIIIHVFCYDKHVIMLCGFLFPP